MSMPTFEAGTPQSVYTLTDLRVAQWDGTQYGTVVRLSEGQNLQFEPQADTDQKKAYGMITRLLTVVTSVKITLGVGLIQADALWAMIGLSQSLSGSGDTATQRLRIDAGGQGLPYFGVVGKFASDDMGEVVLGVPLCKLDAPPSLSSEQNKFILPESSGIGIANSAADNPRGVLVIDQAKAISAVANFNAFFEIS